MEGTKNEGKQGSLNPAKVLRLEGQALLIVQILTGVSISCRVAIRISKIASEILVVGGSEMGASPRFGSSPALSPAAACK
jgi:hypothetical protein